MLLFLEVVVTFDESGEVGVQIVDHLLSLPYEDPFILALFLHVYLDLRVRLAHYVEILEFPARYVERNPRIESLLLHGCS